jgi:hypothetical protein
MTWVTWWDLIFVAFFILYLNSDPRLESILTRKGATGRKRTGVNEQRLQSQHGVVAGCILVHTVNIDDKHRLIHKQQEGGREKGVSYGCKFCDSEAVTLCYYIL